MAEAVYGKKISYKQFANEMAFPIYLLRQFIEARASYEEYTRRESTSTGKNLAFPGGKKSCDDGNTGMLEG
jgi:hypothetical protein